MPTSKDFTHMHMLFNLFRNVLNYSDLWEIVWTSTDCNSANLEQGQKGHTYTNLRPGQYLTHVHSCFALIGAHQYSVHVAVGPMNGGNPCLKDPLLLWQTQSTTLFFCSFFFVTLQYITIVTSIQDFFLPLDQLHTAILGWSLAASCLRKAASW